MYRFHHLQLPPPPFGATTRPGRWRVGLVLVALASAASLVTVLSAVAPVGAQDPFACETPVVDLSGVVDAAAVDVAWSGIDRSRIGPEATVLVRVWDSVPNEDLAGAVDEVVARCVGDPDLGIATDAVVIGLSVEDGLSDVLIGGGWTAATSADSLRTTAMAPALAQGDVTGGLVAALDALADGVADLPLIVDAEPGDEPALDGGGAAEVDENEPTAGTDDTADDGTLASEPVPDSDGDAADGGSPFALALGALGLAACGGAVVLVQRQRALARERDRLKRKVEPALGRLRVLRERHLQLMNQADIWYRTGAGRTRTEIGAGVRQVESAGLTTDRAAGLLHRTIPQGVDDVDRAGARSGQERVAELMRVLEVHGHALDELAALGAHLDHLEVALPIKAELLAHELPEIRKLANTRVDEGWNVDPVRDRLTAIQTAIGDVKEAAALLEVDLLDLSDRLEAAEASLFSVDHELQQLPMRAESLGRWQQRLVDAADHELRRADELRRQLATAALTSAAESWRWAADHPGGAIEALERADAAGERAIGELAAAQRFDDAGHALEGAGLELMVADDLLDQLDDLLVDLDLARAEAPGLVERVAHALGELGATVGRHRNDLSADLVRRAGDLAPVVDGLRTELARPKPNYIRVVETGEETDRAIGLLLVEIDREHQRAEALRRELDRQRARAGRALARARRALGWQLFPSADGSALDRLEAELAALPDDLEAAVDTAADIADGALRLQEQIIARRRRRSAGVTIGSGPPILGGGWPMGGSARRSGSSGGRSISRPGSRSSGGRSFGGRRRSSGGRSFGSSRSTGRF